MVSFPNKPKTGCRNRLGMGQCFSTDCAGLCPKWAFGQQRGYDRYTKFAPKNEWKYADDHLLNEIQDPRSDDDIDLSDISNDLNSPRNSRQSGRLGGANNSAASQFGRQTRPNRHHYSADVAVNVNI